jgi:hypothetical protein
MKFMKNVIVAMERSMKVGHRVVGTAQGCTCPAITWFFVRKYFASENDKDPTR